MIIKKVICHVKDGMDQTLSARQERWAALRECKGFIARYAGWSKDNVANIIAFWNDYQSYVHFMNLDHDLIYKRTNQKESIESIKVQVEDINVRDIYQFATEWLNHVDSVVNEKWTLHNAGGRK
jgi:Domain of unknown function (DUF4937